MVADDLPKLYTEMASWWHLFSAPEEYAEEAAFVRSVICQMGSPPLRTLLELGSGGGNNASHLKFHFDMTLVDLSPAMLAVSRVLNPECVHIEGDMRTVRLRRTFDAVFVHDSIGYMTSLSDLKKALRTAFVHCRPGGVALFLPDYTRESFAPTTEHGGGDGESRGLRYLEWTYDPDENDTVYTMDFACLLREQDGTVRVEHDRHYLGLFPRADWLRLLREVGFEPRPLPAPYEREAFVGVRASLGKPPLRRKQAR